MAQGSRLKAQVMRVRVEARPPCEQGEAGVVRGWRQNKLGVGRRDNKGKIGTYLTYKLNPCQLKEWAVTAYSAQSERDVRESSGHKLISSFGNWGRAAATYFESNEK
jgi:hypothetical protein